MQDRIDRRRRVSAWLLVFGMNSGAALAAAGQPGWVRECPGEAFCFSRPATLVLQPAQVIDSLAARYRDASLDLSFDFGLYSSSFSDLAHPLPEAISIDGRPAHMLSSGKDIALVVPTVHEGQRMKVKFSMLLRFQDRAQPELARRIFHSVEFKPPR